MGDYVLVRRSTLRARRMRSAPTDAERAVWKILRNGQLGGARFRRQYVMKPYILDFVCLEHRLIVEVDGAHHADQAGYDAARDRFFEQQGYRVLRFSNREALLEIEGVAATILQMWSSPPPHPSPIKGEGAIGGEHDSRDSP